MEFPTTTGDLAALDRDEREAMASHLGDDLFHRRLVDELASLRGSAAVHPAEGRPVDRLAGGWLRVAAWNAERGRDIEAAARLLANVDADVVLLSELDVGMARTGNHDTIAELASLLGHGYVFGVEFIELGLGSANERAAHAGSENQVGFHGNAILSRIALEDPVIVRLPGQGAWFTEQSDEPRVGGRIAVLATIAVGAHDVVLASTHLESASDGALRAHQTEALLTAIDRYAPGRPAIVGGDLNTFSLELASLVDRQAWIDAVEADPTRFSWPVPHEPLFALAARSGFAWTAANVPAPTTHHDAQGLPDHPRMKLDWLLCRGVEARRPVTVAAVDTSGAALSDHDLVAASFRIRA